MKPNRMVYIVKDLYQADSYQLYTFIVNQQQSDRDWASPITSRAYNKLVEVLHALQHTRQLPKNIVACTNSSYTLPKFLPNDIGLMDKVHG